MPAAGLGKRIVNEALGGCDTDAMSDGVDAFVLAGVRRRVEYCLYNRGAGQRALFQYGTPGTRWLSPQLIGAARAAGFELLVIDRPGYGMPTGRRPGRRVVDVVADVHAVVGAQQSTGC
jgi:hypothetical protein